MLCIRGGITIMTVSELITMINLESNEILDDNTEYIQYINAAIDYLSMILTSICDREVIKTATIANGQVVPSDFMQFIPANGYPVKIDNKIFYTFNEEKPVPGVMYAVKKNHISDMDNMIPFSELYISYLVLMVSYLVKKKSLMIDYANFDKGFIDDLTRQIQTSKGVV